MLARKCSRTLTYSLSALTAQLSACVPLHLLLCVCVCTYAFIHWLAAGADLDTSYTMAQGLMDGDLAWVIGGAVRWCVGWMGGS